MAFFTSSKYEADSDEVHQIRLSEDIVAVTGNPAPAGDVTSDIKVKITKGNREFGIRPRIAVLQRSIDVVEGDETYKKIFRQGLPILTQAVWDGTVFALEADVEYDGNTWKVVSRQAEDY